MVTVDDIRDIARPLPRSYEVVVRDRIKFRVGRIVFLALSRDETILGFGFPKEEREAWVAAEPELFQLPAQSDLRYNWLQANLAALDRPRLEELIVDAWCMVVPKRVATQYLNA
jgi:hypothetical protein